MNLKATTQVNCPICEHDRASDIDYLRGETNDQKLKLCQTCGLIYYSPIPDEKTLNNYYKTDYRSIVHGGNIVTCNRKLEYHKGFLKGLLNKKMRILDIGAAQGYFLKYLKDLGHEVVGTELTPGFVEYGRREYGLDIKTSLNEVGGKFDMVSIYRVLEHLPNALNYLKNAKELLTDDGLLYISSPRLGKTLINITGGGMIKSFSVDLFPTEHLYTFSGKTLHALLWKAGFKVIKENYSIYPVTLLAQKIKPGDDFEYPTINPDEMVVRLETMKNANDLKNQKKYDEALDVYPYFPEAIIMKSVAVKLPFEKMQGIIAEGLKLMPLSVELNTQYAFNCYRFEQYNDALAYFIFGESLKPGNENVIYHIGMCLMETKRFEEAIPYFKQAIAVNPGLFAELSGMIGKCYAELGKE